MKKNDTSQKIRQSKTVNILIVDDRPENLIAFEAILSEPSYNLVVARSGEEALSRLLRDEFAVILLDVQMPVMDGFETASLIHNCGIGRKTPIIFVTALDTEKRYLDRGYEVGAVDYLVKPLDPHVLRSKVAVFVDLHRKNEEILRQAELIRENERRTHATQLLNLEVQSLRRYRNLADAIPHMVWKSDPQGRLKYCNQVWIDYTQTSLENTHLVEWQQILHPNDLNGFVMAWAEAKKVPPKQLEFVARIKRGEDESYRWHLVRAVPELEDGEVSAWIGTNTDIHDRKGADEALAEKAKELARSNHELEQFAYLASHDLQEPLRMVASYAQLLERRYRALLDAQGTKFINYIVDGATRMQALISDLLTYSRTGKGDLSIVPTDFNVELEITLKDMKDAIQKSGAVVTHDSLPTVNANPTRICALFLNLIANAIKFKRQDGLRIHVSSQEKENHWLFSVQDDGIGIDPQYYERIFIIFQRLHTREEYPGTGIGLAICKKIVELHRGRIWVESKIGLGSTFFFTLSKHLIPSTPAAGGLKTDLESKTEQFKHA